MWYRYQKATGALLLRGTGTSLLVPVPIVYCMWVPVPVYVVPVPLLLSMLPLTVALPGASQQRLPSTAMIYIRSLDTDPYKKCARNSKNLQKHQKHENDQRNLFLNNMRAKCELGVLKSDINVALLCIQQLYFYFVAILSKFCFVKFNELLFNFCLCSCLFWL